MESATCCGMESDQRSEWNHGNAVYGIKPQELYSIRASRNAMRDFVAIPYNTRGALIPYQACGWDKKILQKMYPFLQYFLRVIDEKDTKS